MNLLKLVNLIWGSMFGGEIQYHWHCPTRDLITDTRYPHTETSTFQTVKICHLHQIWKHSFRVCIIIFCHLTGQECYRWCSELMWQFQVLSHIRWGNCKLRSYGWRGTEASQSNQYWCFLRSRYFKNVCLLHGCIY